MHLGEMKLKTCKKLVSIETIGGGDSEGTEGHISSND